MYNNAENEMLDFDVDNYLDETEFDNLDIADYINLAKETTKE